MKEKILLLLIWCSTLGTVSLSQNATAQTQGATTDIQGTASQGALVAVDSARTDSATQATAAFHSDLAERLEGLLADPLLKHARVGLYVYDLTADKPVFAYQYSQTMRPASNMKLLTAITALKTLGGNYLFRTRMYAEPSAADSQAVKTLSFRGGFDPLLDDSDLRAFAGVLRGQGIDRIEGDIILDVTMKDTLRWGSGWCWDDGVDTNPTLSPLLCNGKDVFSAQIVKALSGAGIRFDGRIIKSKAKGNLLDERTHTIDQVLRPMMKNSSNLCAEAMFYQMGRTRKEAAGKVEQIIRSMGYDTQYYCIADGSGVSLYDYVSPELLVAFLRLAYQDENIYLHLLPSLPIAGKDGTLASRMQGEKATGKVFAKTGTVTGISSLGGYATASNGHTLCFSIINDGQQKTSLARTFQDKVCRELVK